MILAFLVGLVLTFPYYFGKNDKLDFFIENTCYYSTKAYLNIIYFTVIYSPKEALEAIWLYWTWVIRTAFKKLKKILDKEN